MPLGISRSQELPLSAFIDTSRWFSGWRNRNGIVGQRKLRRVYSNLRRTKRLSDIIFV
jgi:hypothetical protein